MICPIISKNFAINQNNDFAINHSDRDGFVECQQEKCALWVNVPTTLSKEERREGCAFAISAKKNSQGFIPI